VVSDCSDFARCRYKGFVNAFDNGFHDGFGFGNGLDNGFGSGVGNGFGDRLAMALKGVITKAL
jgi:hypothetical protein